VSFRAQLIDKAISQRTPFLFHPQAFVQFVHPSSSSINVVPCLPRTQAQLIDRHPLYSLIACRGLVGRSQTSELEWHDCSAVLCSRQQLYSLPRLMTAAKLLSVLHSPRL
jgi:hypothetical protein